MRPFELHSPVKEVLEKCLPAEFFTLVHERARGDIVNITCEGCFSRWCSRHCDVDILLNNIFPCKTLDIEIRRDIIVSLSRSKRPTAEQSQQVKKFKEEILLLNNKRKEEYKKNLKRTSKDTKMQVSTSSKKARTYDKNIHIISDQCPLSFEILCSIFSYLYSQSVWKYRQVSRIFLKASKYCPLYIIFYTVDQSVMVRHTRQLILLNVFSCESPHAHTAKDIYDKILASKIEKDTKYALFPDQYKKHVYNIHIDFLREYHGKTLTLFSFNPACGIDVAPSMTKILHISRWSQPFIYSGINTFLISKNIHGSKFWGTIPHGSEEYKKYNLASINSYSEYIEDEISIQLALIQIHNVKNVMIDIEDILHFGFVQVITSATSPTNVFIYNASLLRIRGSENESVAFVMKHYKCCEWVKKYMPNIQNIIFFGSFKDGDPAWRFKLNYKSNNIYVVSSIPNQH